MSDAGATALLDWYARVGRDLPWRRTRDPYRILVAEVMLQQTQAARVVPHYAAWLARFPDAGTLAAAPLADALRAWSGLGYNRRALALRAAAAQVTARGWPTTATELRDLPGVGPYTAAAVAAFAFDEQIAAIDTNVRRVIARLDRRERTPAALARRAAQLLPNGRAADWNQAMMDLGATVCLPRRPVCAACPLARCRSRGRVLLPTRPRSAAPAGRRFQDTDRYVRGRIVADLVAGRTPADSFGGDRLERALVALERDGLVVREGGRPRLA